MLVESLIWLTTLSFNDLAQLARSRSPWFVAKGLAGAMDRPPRLSWLIRRPSFPPHPSIYTRDTAPTLSASTDLRVECLSHVARSWIESHEPELLLRCRNSKVLNVTQKAV